MVLRHLAFALLVAGSVTAVGCAPAENEDDVEDAPGDALVGGTPDLRWAAAGHLVHGRTFEEAAAGKVACGATLVAPNVVVTAAHCVLAAPDDVWAFGTGHLGSARPMRVVSRRVHPQFHPEPQAKVDVKYFLKNFDVATLVLERPVANVAPAILPRAKADPGCGYVAIGHRADSKSPGRRRSTPACVLFNVSLLGDPIFEVHPKGDSALCNGDGDEGAALISGTGAAPTLHGIYVGSVTQGFTDCKAGTQYLNGHESMFGFKDFVEESIRQAESER